MKPFYVHLRNPLDKYRGKERNRFVGPFNGATVYVEDHTDSRMVQCGIALCSRKDVYNKKIGRTIAKERAGSVIIHKKELHEMLGALYQSVTNTDDDFVKNNYYYVYRKMV